MKIGHYGNGIWGNGGIASYIDRISKSQKSEGHTVSFFDLSAYAAQPNNKHNIIYAENDHDVIVKAVQAELDILHVHTTQFADVTSALPMLRTLHGHQPYCPSSTRFLKRWNKPCDRSYNAVSCLWGHVADHCGSVRPQNMIKLFGYTEHEIHNARLMPVVTVSDFLKREMIRSGYASENIYVLHLPAPEVMEYSPPPYGIPHFVFLGRITSSKGLNWLIKALKQVKTVVHLDIAGEGNELAAMQDLVDKIGLARRVTFHGWVDDKRIKALLTGSRAVVFPSIWHEPAGLVSLDAAAAGRAVLGSRVGGLPEYAVHGKNALLVEPNDVQGLANVIEQLANDWDLAQQLGALGYAMVQTDYPLKSHMASLYSLYAGAIQKHQTEQHG